MKKVAKVLSVEQDNILVIVIRNLNSKNKPLVSDTQDENGEIMYLKKSIQLTPGDLIVLEKNKKLNSVKTMYLVIITLIIGLLIYIKLSNYILDSFPILVTLILSSIFYLISMFLIYKFKIEKDNEYNIYKY